MSDASISSGLFTVTASGNPQSTRNDGEKQDDPVNRLTDLNPNDIASIDILRTRERIAKVISKQTGKALAKVLADMERDFWLSADEAIEYGLVSRIIESSRELG